MNLKPGAKLVGTAPWDRPRRKTKQELAAMSAESRLYYEIFVQPPMTNEEQEAALRYEDANAGYEEGDDISVGSRAYDDGPPGEYPSEDDYT